MNYSHKPHKDLHLKEQYVPERRRPTEHKDRDKIISLHHKQQELLKKRC